MVQSGQLNYKLKLPVYSVTYGTPLFTLTFILRVFWQSNWDVSASWKQKKRQIKDHRECCFSVSSKLSNKSNFCRSCEAQLPGRALGRLWSGVVAQGAALGSALPAQLSCAQQPWASIRAPRATEHCTRQWAVTLKFLPCSSNVRDIIRIRFPLNYTSAKGYNCIKRIMLLP